VQPVTGRGRPSDGASIARIALRGEARLGPLALRWGRCLEGRLRARRVVWHNKIFRGVPEYVRYPFDYTFVGTCVIMYNRYEL
jgi:hypothetical protein